jgi:hypothetical protein
MKVSGQHHTPATLPLYPWGKNISTHLTGDWASRREEKNSCPAGIQTPDRPVPQSSHYINYAYIQSNSWVMDVTVGDDFLGLCDKKNFLPTWVLFWMHGAVGVFWFVYMQSCKPCIRIHGVCYMLCNLEEAGSWCNQITLVLCTSTPFLQPH